MSWGMTDDNEIKFITSFLFIEGKSTKKEIETKWCNSSHWNGKKYTSTLQYSLAALCKDGVVSTDKTNKAYEFSLKY